jgi:hypothetical protein
MAEPGPPTPTVNEPETAQAAPLPPGRSKDEIALELMKFIAISTGYGKASVSSAGFSGKPVARSAEEHADALFELFDRCRKIVNQE